MSRTVANQFSPHPSGPCGSGGQRLVTGRPRIASQEPVIVEPAALNRWEYGGVGTSSVATTQRSGSAIVNRLAVPYCMAGTETAWRTRIVTGVPAFVSAMLGATYSV